MNIKSIFTTYILPAIALLVLTMIFFYPQLQNKSMTSSDISASQGMQQELQEYRQETGKVSWWTNSMFGGMPNYQISGRQETNLLRYVDRALALFVKRPIGLFFLVMLCAYISLLLFKSPPWVSFFGAAVIGLSVSNLLLFSSGHMTKIKTIGYCIPLFMGLYLAYQKNRWAGLGLYGTALGLALFSNHPQMLYYMGLSLIIFGVIALVDAIKNNKIAEFGITTGGLIVISLIALASSASKIMPTLEYAKDTMRGIPLLTIKAESADSKSSEVEGLDWQYATNWSNGALDLVAGFIPGAAGESGSAIAPSGSITVKNLKKQGRRVPNDIKLPLYWGGMSSTGGVFYFGAALLFLLFLQFFIGDKKLSIWLAVSLLLMAMMSMGRNLEGFNRFLFDHLPYLNKFRTPNSISSVMSAMIGLGAAFGLHALVKTNLPSKELTRKILYAAAPLAVISLFFMLLGPGFFDFSGMNDAYYAQSGFNIDDLKADRKLAMRNTAFRSFIFVALAALASWVYATKKIKQPVLVLVLTVIALIDLTGVGRKYVPFENFKTQRKNATEFVQRPVDKQILGLEKSRGTYRVLDQSVNTYNSAQTSYWHNTIGGYHPAKLQRFEDIKNFHLYKGNQAVYDMLNTKYIITKDQKLRTNPGALGNAWFVKNIKTVANNDEEIQALTGLNASETAIVHQEFNDVISGLQPTGDGTINMTNYTPDQLTYSSSSNAEELAVFSEVYYGPDKGWEATIDGQPVELIRVNYILRGVKIPAGNHEIILSFRPASVKTGSILSLISSILLIAFAGYLIFQYFKNNPLKKDHVPEIKTSANKAVYSKKKKK